MIRVDAVWLATTPLDMRAGTETTLTRVVQVFGSAKLHHAYLFANRRAAAIMSLIQTAKLNGHDPYAYLHDVLTRLPTHKNSELGELLQHRWHPVHRPDLE